MEPGNALKRAFICLKIAYLCPALDFPRTSGMKLFDKAVFSDEHISDSFVQFILAALEPLMNFFGKSAVLVEVSSYPHHHSLLAQLMAKSVI